MSTQTQSGSATVTPGYDPSYSPYTAPTTPPPEITAPPPHAQEDTRQSQTPSLIGGKGAGITKIATVVDSILKGAMRGRDYANQVKAYKQQRLAQGLNYNYQTARNNYLGMLKSGADPNSKEVQEAKSAADAAWQVQQQFYQNMFGQQNGKGKGNKSKSKQSTQGGNDPQNPLVMWASNDPVDKLRAAVMIRQKIGPDYTSEAAMYTSPEYQRQLKLMRGEQGLAEGSHKMRLRLQELEGKQSPTDQDRQEIETLRRNIEFEANPAAAARVVPHMATKDTPGSALTGVEKDALGNPIDPQRTYRQQMVGDQVNWIPVTPSTAGVAKPVRAWTIKQGKPVSVELDPKTNQIIPGTENANIAPPAGMMEHVRTGEFSWTDADGNIHRTQTTTTTTPVVPGTGAGAGGGGGHAAGAHEPTVSKPGPLGVKPPPSGDRIVGNKGPTGQTKSRADAADSVLRMIPKAQQMLQDPEVRDGLGALSGRWSEVEKKIGTLSPKLQEFYGTLKSVYALNGAMHGWRSIKAPEEFEKAYGSLNTEPDTLLGGLKAAEDSAKAIYESGYKHPWKLDGSTGTGSSAPTGSPSTPLSPDLKNKLDADFGPAK